MKNGGLEGPHFPPFEETRIKKIRGISIVAGREAESEVMPAWPRSARAKVA